MAEKGRPSQPETIYIVFDQSRSTMPDYLIEAAVLNLEEMTNSEHVNILDELDPANLKFPPDPSE